MTALLFGYAHDPMVKAVSTALDTMGADVALWSPRDLMNDCDLRVGPGGVDGAAMIGDRIIGIDEISGIFNRQSNVELTPEFRALDADDRLADHALAASGRASEFCDLAPCLVMNRSAPNASNSSKPLQSLLIAEHFFVPRTCITNDYDIAAEFCARMGRVIYKSCSGERSIVTELEPGQLEARREMLTACPVQFQERVEGRDMRVHVVGESIFATEVRSDKADYRYDGEADWRAATVSDEVAAAAIALTRKLGLVLAGIDLRYCDDGRVFCFEVNPSPAFSAYQEATGQPISDEVAAQLAAGGQGAGGQG
ncbi:ATP-grasp domain-containing protein [Palleronia pelagia]|uniref:RimK-like ATP-grasp domain-containing protein n=1 Tax=Palleronia pelagia TaxID=387096 RepID=A0A1H8KQ07_9RHOB|nr:hypothetical protein [Palleronia pelagia]SEN94990.1 RimK-like ATP-grasp domain-containing protein [Palleronia pelagia]